MPQHLDIGPGTGLAVQPDLAAQAQRLHVQRRTRSLLIGADYRMRQRVGHPDGGDCPVEEILRAEADQRGQIEFETMSGSRKHHRLPPAMRRVSRLVLAANFCPLLYLFAGITGVRWSSPVSASLALAGIMALVATALSYNVLAFTGHQLRAFKNHAGTIYRDELDRLTKTALSFAVVLVVVLAVLMFTCTAVEAPHALGRVSGYGIPVIAAAMTVVNAAANCLVVAVQALDGSDQVARLNRLSSVVRRSAAAAHWQRQQAARASRPHCKAGE